MGRIIELRCFDKSIDAEIALGILRSEGIECELSGLHLDSIVLPMLGGSDPMLKLIINEDDKERVEALLAAAFDKEEFEENYL